MLQVNDHPSGGRSHLCNADRHAKHKKAKCKKKEKKRHEIRTVKGLQSLQSQNDDTFQFYSLLLEQ